MSRVDVPISARWRSCQHFAKPGTGHKGMSPTMRTDLCAAAVEYVEAGWPICPTRPPEHEQVVCRLVPPDTDTAREWWSSDAYGICCLTGRLFDVLQVPAALGPLVLRRLDPAGAPVISVERSTGSVWCFLVTAGAPVIADIPRASQARLFAADEWVLMPPTESRDGPVSWLAPPEDAAELHLPHSLEAQWAVVRAWKTLRYPTTTQRDNPPATHQPPTRRPEVA